MASVLPYSSPGREGEPDEPHESTTDPGARLYRKGPGKEAKLCFIGHAPMENRSALFVGACLTGSTAAPGAWRRFT